LNPIFQRAAYEGLTAQQIDKSDKPPKLFFSNTRGMAGMREAYQQPLLILMGMVILVLVIACGNVAMLLVARNAARQREFSVRIALGGSRARIFRQLLTEGLLLVTAGGLLGWVFAIWSTRALASWSQMEASLAPDRVVLFFSL